MADFNFNDENNPIAVLKMPILVGILVIVLVIIAGMAYLKPALETYSTTNSEYKTTLQNYNAKLQELDDLKASAELANSPKENAENTALEKEFFKPMEAGSDPDVILAGEFNEILSLMIANKIKTRSVDYDYEPKDDPFYNFAKSKYSVCKLDMVMIANYTDFKNFMKDLYKHEHYLDIAKVEIEPYQKDKSILIFHLQLKLYAEKV